MTVPETLSLLALVTSVAAPTAWLAAGWRVKSLEREARARRTAHEVAAGAGDLDADAIVDGKRRLFELLRSPSAERPR